MAPTGSSQKSSATVWGATKRCVVPAGDAMAGHIAHLKDMGFCESQARKALAECVWDVNRAIDLLVSRGAAALAKPALPKGGAKESSGSSDHTEVVSNKGIDLDNSSTASGVSTPRCCSSSVAPESGHAELKDDEERNKRSIRRVCRKVTSQDAQQLSADPGEFVRVWPFYETELGWIYAEDPTDASRAGWLPTAILESIEAGHEWVYVQKAMPALHANQLGVEEGEILKINLASRTPEGWVYAQKEKTEAGKVSGWVPVCSFVWNNPQ